MRESYKGNRNKNTNVNVNVKSEHENKTTNAPGLNSDKSTATYNGIATDAHMGKDMNMDTDT